jgi:hypothetical protein
VIARPIVFGVRICSGPSLLVCPKFAPLWDHEEEVGPLGDAAEYGAALPATSVNEIAIIAESRNFMAILGIG